MERRHAILGFLKLRGTASLAELAAHLEVTKQAALRHLDALETDGLVEHRAAPSSGPGRPGSRYRLTPAADAEFPHAHRELAGELVAFLDREQLAGFFAGRAARLEKDLAAELDGLKGTARARRLAELGAAGGHMTEFHDNGDGAVTIRHCHCPIGDVAATTGEPCRHELEMYARLLGADVERTTWLGASDSSCTFVIKGGK